jgi:hypothetical protein
VTNLSTDDYVKALERMKKSSRDRLGILGELGVTGIGVGAGIAASGTIAAAAGGATLAGSSVLASVLGGVFVTSTPVGWVVGSAALGGLLACAAGKLIRGGAKADVRKLLTVEELEKRINLIRRQGQDADHREQKMQALITGLQHLVVNKRISQDKATQVLRAVENDELTPDAALDAIAGHVG